MNWRNKEQEAIGKEQIEQTRQNLNSTKQQNLPKL